MKDYKVIVVKGDIFKLEEELNWLNSIGADIVSVMYITDDVYQVVYSQGEQDKVDYLLGELV